MKIKELEENIFKTYLIVGLPPQCLKLGVTSSLVREIIVHQYVVHFSEVTSAKSHDSPSPENTFGLVQFLHRQRPQKSVKPLDLSIGLEGLTVSSNLTRESLLLYFTINI